MKICSRRIFCALVAGVAVAPSLAGCNAVSSARLSMRYGDPLLLTYAPTNEKYSATGDTIAYLVDDEGDYRTVEVSDDAVYDADGSGLDKADIVPGDMFKVYFQDEADDADGDADGPLSAVAMMLTEHGGEDAAALANLAYAEANAWEITLVYTPEDEDEYSANLDGTRASLRFVAFDEAESSVGIPTSASLGERMIYGEEGSMMELDDIQPGDVFVGYATLVQETYPPSYSFCRLELVARGGWPLVRELLDIWDYEV